MGKISPVSAKYIVNAHIEIEGMVDKPDVIGAIFGQTEGLLGEDLELRELQRSGKIGRIEVDLKFNHGKTAGNITIPSSLDKAETVIIAAALEIIERIGPCNAKINTKAIEDIRITKRNYIISRAKDLLKNMFDTVLPDSQELTEEVSSSVRVMEMKEYGKEKLACGPTIEESDEIIILEGRADVLNLLKHGIKNTIAMNGTHVPDSLIELAKKKAVTVFVDGDRGGDLIIRELLETIELDYIVKAPDGKEVEELAKKEIHKALRGKIAAEQIKMELDQNKNFDKYPRKSFYTKAQEKKKIDDDNKKRNEENKTNNNTNNNNNRNNNNNNKTVDNRNNNNNNNKNNNTNNNTNNDKKGPKVEKKEKLKNLLSSTEKSKLKDLFENLIGTKGALLLDQKLSIFAKLPISELNESLSELNENNISSIIIDGDIDKILVQTAENLKVKTIVGMETKVNKKDFKPFILTMEDF